MRKSLATMAFVLSISAASAVFADDHKVDWAGHCKAEMEKFKCDANGKDEDIYQCLLKHDADISKDCDNNAHSKYEEITGKSK